MRQLKITKSITNRESQSLEKYLQEIGKVDLLSPEDEVALAKRIKEGDEQALEKLTKANLRFVVSVAKQYQNQGLSLPDLINEGNLGLIKAAQRFDETRGFKFISYAVWWIRQSILQALAEQSRIVRLPLNKIGSINKINKMYAFLEQENERPPSAEEIAKKEASYEHPCYFEKDGCPARFKTMQGMLTHTTTCPFNYANTSKYFDVEAIRAVYGKAERKLFLVKWEGYEESENSWLPEQSLLRDGCKESIDAFWLESGLNPAEDFYKDPDCRPRCWMCGWACDNPHPKYLKAHLTRKGHNWYKKRAHQSEKKDVKKDKYEAAQTAMQKVRWGEQDVRNCWQFEYLGSIFQADGDHMPDVKGGSEKRN